MKTVFSMRPGMGGLLGEDYTAPKLMRHIPRAGETDSVAGQTMVSQFIYPSSFCIHPCLLL
jgi:hypothetical protein